MWDYSPTENKLKARALIMFLKDSGVRVSDASTLNLKDYLEAKRIDQNGEKFAVFKPLETRKTKAPAHIHLGPESINAIDAYVEEPRKWKPTDKDPEEPLFLNRFGRRSNADTLGQLFVRLAKLLKAENVSAHSLSARALEQYGKVRIGKYDISLGGRDGTLLIVKKYEALKNAGKGNRYASCNNYDSCNDSKHYVPSNDSIFRGFSAWILKKTGKSYTKRARSAYGDLVLL